MAHDPLVENRIADVLTAQGVQADPVKMFGGMAFMVRGNMCVGITNKGDFMVRFNAERHAEVSEWPGAKPITMGKGDTKGFLFVDAEAVGNKKSLEKWVKLSLEHVLTLPPKVKKAKAKKSGSKGK
ncbi:MAG TPA: TfoX/Sxy family protein [Flavobacteriales bacterium]|nr:TfoX/Sxy family protein [Flavobacteriales bacterium]HRO40939.1 TfoX/Sxy family protein [Flavobacteriales bacterium]HRP82987.1 TfoX/Sxy family protein [Flavobacteriales bacterium]HRQ84215.1 TfoX/Sxy family protein [Flavobacteriales bacterium]